MTRLPPKTRSTTKRCCAVAWASWALACGSLTNPDEVEDDPIAPPTPEVGSLTREELDAPSPDSGLQLFGVTNFEFDSPPFASLPANIYTFGDELARATAFWNTRAPISGRADLRLDFMFSRGPALLELFRRRTVGGARGSCHRVRPSPFR